MPTNDNDINNDELIMDEEIQPKSTDNKNALFSQSYIPTQDKKPVIPFLLGGLVSLALIIGLCFLSLWALTGLTVAMGLLAICIKNNDYNNLQEANELAMQKKSQQSQLGTPTQDLIVENGINNGQNLLNSIMGNICNNKKKETNYEMPEEEKKNEEETNVDKTQNKMSDNKKDEKSNYATQTNLDLINKVNQEKDSLTK